MKNFFRRIRKVNYRGLDTDKVRPFGIKSKIYPNHFLKIINILLPYDLGHYTDGPSSLVFRFYPPTIHIKLLTFLPQ